MFGAMQYIVPLLMLTAVLAQQDEGASKRKGKDQQCA